MKTDFELLLESIPPEPILKIRKLKLLFVCTINRMRSATTHKIYENDRLEEQYHFYRTKIEDLEQKQ